MLGTNVQDSRDIVLGAGVLFFNGINCGQLKGDVAFTPSAEYKEFTAGVPQQTVKILKFKEGASLKASYAEMNAANFARALNIEESAIVYETGTVSSESKVLSGTETVQLSKGRFVSGVVVKKGATTAVLNTDYTIINAARGEIARVATSETIGDGDTVTVDYTYRKKAIVSFGGGAQPSDVPAKFVYTSPDGDTEITIEFPKAKWKAGNDITFKEEDFSTSDVEIVAVSDPSKPAGKQLGTVTFEYFPE